MKRSMKRLYLSLAIVVSLVAVQGGWAGQEIVELTGTALSVSNRSIELDTNGDGELDVTVIHLGPPSYWEEEIGCTYPSKGDELTIYAYLNKDGLYIAVTVIYGETECPIRDAELKPLWR